MSNFDKKLKDPIKTNKNSSIFYQGAVVVYWFENKIVNKFDGIKEHKNVCKNSSYLQKKVIEL